MERIELPLADAKSKAAGPSPHPSFGEVAEGPGPLSHLPFARGAAAAAGGEGGSESSLLHSVLLRTDDLEWDALDDHPPQPIRGGCLRTGCRLCMTISTCMQAVYACRFLCW